MQQTGTVATGKEETQGEKKGAPRKTEKTGETAGLFDIKSHRIREALKGQKQWGKSDETRNLGGQGDSKNHLQNL